jgi:hypothetical protein
MVVATSLLLCLSSLSFSDDYRPSIPAGMVARKGTGRTAKAGERGVIYTQQAPSAVSSFDLEELLKYIKAGDQVGIETMVRSRRAFRLPAATPFLLIDSHLSTGDTGSYSVKSSDFARSVAASGAAQPAALETLEVRVLEGPLKDKALFIAVDDGARLFAAPPAPKPSKGKAKAKSQSKSQSKSKTDAKPSEVDKPKD